MAKIPHRLYLTEDQMPKQWYNLRADMKEKPDPLIHPGTHQPLPEEALYPIFCKKLAHQELDNDTRYIDIPEPVLDMYKLYRPSPLCRAYNLRNRASRALPPRPVPVSGVLHSLRHARTSDWI